MVRILFLLLVLFQATSSFASGSLTLPDSPLMESSPQSKEIKKIVKQLENPLEREKLLKTLKVLAAAQEKEEKKRGGSLVAYITPIIQFGMDSASEIFTNLKKIPAVANEFIEYLKVEENRKDLWTALLLWLPILVLMAAFFEWIHVWLFKRHLAEISSIEKGQEFVNKKSNYAIFTLFLPFFYPISFLPLFISNHAVWNWVVGFWVFLFVIRIFLLDRKTLPLLPVITGEKHSPAWIVLLRYLAVGLAGIWVLVGSIFIVLRIKGGQDYILNPVLLMAFTVFVLWYREWKAKEMFGYLQDSKSLATAPKKLASLMNVLIRYLPVLFLLFSIPLIIDKVLFEGHLWETYGMESIGSLISLAVFMEGRRVIDVLSGYKLPKFQAVKIQAFMSYISPLLLPFIRILQWIWHLSFFVVLLAIWDNCFSSLFVGIFSHPMVKTVTTIGMIWGIIYLAWLALDFFVQFHTKPQTIKGKRREPTVFAKTFGPMLHSVARWVMVLVTIFVTLESFGFDLKILVYLMSAFAFAVSLGSQSLVKDIINGFFALVDGSFAVGDVVTIGTYTGTVESLTLRSITLRHNTGFLQTIPFSEVGNIINRSRNYNVVPIDVATSYKTKIGSVHEALTKTAEDMATDPVFGKMILEPLNISGVDRFAENAVHVSASIKITPDPNNYFAREFNRRLKTHMDALRIAPPIAFQEKWSNG